MDKVKNERILLLCWHNATQALPEVGERVLCKTNSGEVFIGFKRTDGRWSLVGTGLIGEDAYICWRPIHQGNIRLENLYYGDDAGRPE